MPFFSIIIPSYNRAHLISTPVSSILAQEYADLELIIVDDGSKDNTKEVIDSFAESDPRIRYIYQENAERGAARNNGYRNALGNYVIFFDSDDHMLPGHLSEIKKIIDQFPGIKFLSTKFRLVEGEKVIPLTIDSLKEGWHEGSIYLTGTHTGVMIAINRENENIFLFEEDRRYATLEDWMFLLQNILRDKIYIIDKYTVLVDNHDQRSSRIDNQAVIRKRLLANDWIKSNVSLTPSEARLLDGYSYKFCAIHAYLDNSTKDAIKFALKSMRKTGLTFASIILLAKIIVGQKLSRALKRTG